MMRSMAPTDRQIIRDFDERWAKHAARFSRWCMSNTKWRKLFLAVHEAQCAAPHLEHKTIESTHIFHALWPGPRDLGVSRFNDTNWQPFDYRWIEWIRIPRQFEPHPGVGFTVAQDVDAIAEVIRQTLHASIDLDEQFLWIYGYRN